MTELEIPSLEFTKNLSGVFADHVIAAFSRPIPKDDPLSSYRYLRGRNDILIGSARQRPLIRLQDKNLDQLATIGQEFSCVTEEIAADSGEATVVIRGGDYLGDFVRNAVRIDEDLHLSVDPIASQPSWKTRWGGKITTINVKRDSSGIHTVELVATANREHLKTILIGATPFFPPEVQPIKMWMLPANIRTGCFITLWTQLLRLFFPALSIPTNIANPAGWLNPLGPDALLNFSPLHWPIQAQFVNPVLDQSRTSLLAAAWNNFHEATVDPLKDAGCTARAYTYFTDDVDNPHPELEKLIPKTPLSEIPIVGGLVQMVEAFLNRTGLTALPPHATLADLARPSRNCVMVAFEDHSGYAGPTGTAADGVINFFASTLDDLITTTVFPVDADDDGEIDPVFRKLFLVAPPKPWAIYRDGQHSGIIESGYHQHKGPVKTTMTGGKSPKLVNDLQTFAIRYAISQIAQAVVMAGELPAVEGLDNLYQGQLDNCVAGDTIIHGPEGNSRIDALAASGESFRVWSVTPDGLRVPATADCAFKKGTAELFEYTLEDGRSIKATGQHRFLTDRGYVPGELVESGTRFATVDHEELPRRVIDVAPQIVNDALYKDMSPTDAVRFRQVVGVKPLGVDDFYDMHVPGWENYSANGIWNHNTLLAYQRYTNPLRALFTGDVAYQEHFERGGGTAYTLSGILTLRTGDWKKRAYRSFKTSIRNAAPYMIGYDILLDDRVGFEQDGILYVDQVSAIKYEYDRQKPITYTVSVGDESRDRDPFAQGIKALQAVYTIVAMGAGEGLLF